MTLSGSTFAANYCVAIEVTVIISGLWGESNKGNLSFCLIQRNVQWGMRLFCADKISDRGFICSSPDTLLHYTLYKPHTIGYAYSAYVLQQNMGECVRVRIINMNKMKTGVIHELEKKYVMNYSTKFILRFNISITGPSSTN